MSWFYANSVTITNGQTIVTVNSGEDIALAQAAGGLIVGSNPPVEIKRSYLGDGGQGRIELLKPWPYANQSNQPGYAFPTDGDLASATAVLRVLIDGFTIATQAEMQGGTENTHVATALRVKQAIDFWRPAITDVMEFTAGKFLKMGSFGLGRKLDLRAGTTNYYATYFDTPTKAFNKGTCFGFMGAAELGIAGFSGTADYGIFINHSHWDDISGSAGSAFQQFLHSSGTYFRYPASATAWAPWRKNLATGDFGFGTQIAGIKEVYTVLTPSEIMNNAGNNMHYSGNILNHGASAPEPWGIVSGYITNGNNYSYSYQDFTGINGDRYRRKAASSSAWTGWKKVLEEGDYGIGGSAAMRAMPILDGSGGYDFNDYVKAGWYKMLINASASSNYPPIAPNISMYWYLEVLEYASQQIQQYAHGYLTCDASGNPGPAYSFTRTRFGGVWSKWQPAMVPPVGTVQYNAANACSSGAVIENGSNANGSYTKFADGTMICTFTRTAALGVSSYSSGLFVGDFIWQYPAGFVSGSPISIQGSSADSAVRGWLSCSSLNASQALINCYSSAASNTSTYTTVTAIGRWR